MVKKLAVLFAVLSALPCVFPAHAAGSSFLNKTVTINWLHFAKAYDLFTAESETRAVLRITNTTPDKSYWGYVVLNSRTYWLDNDDSFIQPVSLKPLNGFYVSLLGAPGTALHIEIVPPAPVITSFTITPASIVHGSTATLAWATENADTVSLEPAIGAVDPSGSLTVTPGITTTYTLTATNAYDSVSTAATVAVLYPPAITIAEPDGINDIADESFTIQWEDEDPDSNAAISLYYDTDNTGADGTVIVLGLSEDPDGMDDQFIWNTSAILEGDYYIYAVIDDGATPAMTVYSAGPVTVFHNTPPVFNPVADQQVMEEQQLTFTVHADDADNDPLTYSAANLPDGALFDPATQIFSWTPALGQAGVYAPEFTVTDGEATDAMTVTVIVSPNPPAVSITAVPETIIRGNYSTLTWTSAWADACVISPDIGVIDTNGSAFVDPVATATYTITAFGPGGTATAEVTVTVVTPPTVAIHAEPASINIGQSATLTWNATDADTVFIDQGIGSVASNGSITVTPQTTTTYTITASSPVGTVSSSATVTVGNPFTITITSPQENEVVPLSDDGMADIMVSGQVENTSGNETGVNINGVIASLSNNEFTVNLPLTEEGSNTIAVTAVDATGSTHSQSITVHAVPAAHYIRVSANPESAATPMNVYLRVDGSFSIANPVITVSGPGTVDPLTSDEPEEYGYKINTEGIYFFTVGAVGPDGNTYQDTVAVTALDRVEMDTMLRAKWSAFTSAMQGKDTTAMLAMMLPRSRDKYQVMFGLLEDQLPEIAATYTGIELEEISENSASYKLRALKDGAMRSFRLGFMQDANGLWYIEEF